jgi:hypothetical protein
MQKQALLYLESYRLGGPALRIIGKQNGEKPDQGQVCMASSGTSNTKPTPDSVFHS